MLKRVADIPGTKRRRESYVAADVREFARNRTYDVAEVAIEGKSCERVCLAIRGYIAKNPEQCKGIRVCRRNGKVYLYRDETRS